MRIVVPSGLDEFREDILPAGICFGDHHPSKNC
jgi:hypothetical protein